MSTRETFEFETPETKAKVVMHKWMSGGDKRAIFSTEDKAKQQEVMITRLVVSVNGSAENVLQALDDMHGKDFDAVLLKIKEVTENSTYSEEKKS